MDNDILSFVNLRRVFFQNIFRIIIIMTISVILFSLYYIFSIKTYESKTLIQIDYSQSNSTSIETSIFSGNDDTSLEEQMLIYKSRSNLKEIASNLQLNIAVNGEPIKFSSEDIKLVKNSKFLFKYDDLTKNFKVLLQPNSYDIFDDENLILQGNYGEFYELDRLRIGIDKPLEVNREIYLSFMPEDSVIERYLDSQLRLTKVATERDFFTQGSLIEASYISYNRNLSNEILNEANKIFINNSVKSNAQEASRSLDFLDNQIYLLKKNLERQVDEANDFKEKNKSLSIEAESLAVIDQYQLLITAINNTEVEIADASVLYKDTNPRIVGLKKQLSELQEQEAALQKEISLLPKQQQIFIELSREIEINRLILDVLQQKKVEFSLLEASTLGNVKVIDDAYVSNKVSPKGIVGLVTFLIFGAFVSVIYSFIRSTYYMPINLPSDITDDMPDFQITGVIKDVLGEFATIEEENFEQTNTLVTNITHDNFDDPNCTTMVITGPAAGVGKTTTCLLIAKCLASRDKKVLLLDCDYRRGDINKKLNLELLPNMDFLKENANHDKYLVSENLYFIPRPKKSASSSLRIFESAAFKLFIDKNKEFFDYIVIDTPPCLAITDSLVLSRLSERRYLVCRHAKSRIGEVTAARNSFDSINMPLTGCIYNAFSSPKGMSYYDYSAYKYYGYKYYDYAYKTDEEG